MPVVSSDVLRKRLAGVDVSARARPEHYTKDFTRAVYLSLAREALARLESEKNIEVIAEADDLTGAAHHVHGHRPHVLVLDLGMCGMSSLQKIGQLRERVPDTQIVIVAMEENPAFAQRALAAGAIGFVWKDLCATTRPAECVRFRREPWGAAAGARPRACRWHPS